MAKKSTKTRSKTRKSRKEEARLALVLPNFSRYFLIIALILAVLLFLWVLSPFFAVLIYAALIAVFFDPVNKWFIKIFKGHKGISAFLSTFIVILLVLGPLSIFILFLAQEAVTTYQILEAKLLILDVAAIDLNRLETIPYVGEQINDFLTKYKIDELLRESNFDLYTLIQDLGQAVSTFIVNSSAALVKSVGNTVVNLMILVLTLFFFFRDGDSFREYLKALSPLPKKHENAIEDKLRETTYGIAIGTFGTAILQGIMGGVGFAIAGLEHAIFYATIMAFSSLIPYIGSSIIWGPAAIALLLQGEVGWGIFLIAWGIIVIANIDNVTRPYLIGQSASMHPLATFLSVLGGLFVFGINGIIFGPLILSLVLTLFHIYLLEYKEILA